MSNCIACTHSFLMAVSENNKYALSLASKTYVNGTMWGVVALVLPIIESSGHEILIYIRGKVDGYIPLDSTPIYPFYNGSPRKRKKVFFLNVAGNLGSALTSIAKFTIPASLNTTNKTIVKALQNAEFACTKFNDTIYITTEAKNQFTAYPINFSNTITQLAGVNVIPITIALSNILLLYVSFRNDTTKNPFFKLVVGCFVLINIFHIALSVFQISKDFNPQAHFPILSHALNTTRC